MPLNGRQFANLAATVPGVGLSFHSDPTKSTQYAPLVNGGAGRNINYQIDGGDNNDDTVGGLLQPFPLEAIEQFNFQTQRFKAEYGRSNGGVLSVVTKSGTNLWSGSAFEFFRDKSMNAQTETEILADRPTPRRPPVTGKGDYRQNQFGGSFGGPIVKDQAHFFVAVERTNQDKTQAVNTQGLFPSKDGVFAVPYRETPFTGKVTANLSAEPVPVGALRPRHQLAAVQRRAQQHVRQLGRQHEQVQLDQPEPQLGAGRIEAERVHLPVRRLRQHDRVAQLGAERELPERRDDRRQRQHAADHRAAEVSSSATTSRGTRAAAAASATTSRSASTSSTSRTSSSPSTPARARCSTPTSPTT